MTLIWPSFLAAATSLSMPPRALTLVALAASLAPPSSFGGGEQATAVVARREAAMRAEVRENDVRTFPPLRRSGTGPALLQRSSSISEPAKVTIRGTRSGRPVTIEVDQGRDRWWRGRRERSEVGGALQPYRGRVEHGPQ